MQHEARPSNQPKRSRMSEQPPAPGRVSAPDDTSPGENTSAETIASIGQVKTGRGGDAVFGVLTKGASIVVISIVAFVAAFLLWRAVPALMKNEASFLFSRIWEPATVPPKFGIAGLFYTTVVLSTWALLLAVPVSIGLALFLTQVAPRRIGTVLARLVDVLAAVPSIIYGLWGVTTLAPLLLPVGTAITGFMDNRWFTHWFPFTRLGITDSGTLFAAGVVLAIMVLPIVTSISREVYAATPIANKEAALALGATRWEMIRLTVLPYGRSGTVSAAMLGLGRALGETIAVMIILSAPFAGAPFNPSLFAGGETFASKIAASASEFNAPTQTGAYIAAGLVLFAITFVVNAIARIVVERSRRNE
jgi:phosphate transport system permease protein